MVGKVIDIDIIMIVKQKQFVIGDDAAGGWVPGSHHRIQRLQYKPDQNFFSACRKPAGNVKHTITNIWHYLNDVLYYKIQCYVCKFVTSMCYQNEEDHVFGKIKASRIHFLKLNKSSSTLKYCNPPIVSPALGPLVHTHHVEFWGNCEVDQLLAASQVRTNVLCLDQTSFPYCLQFCRPTVDLNFGCECYLWTWLTWCKHRACCKDCPVQQPPSRSIRLKIESGNIWSHTF